MDSRILGFVIESGSVIAQSNVKLGPSLGRGTDRAVVIAVTYDKIHFEITLIHHSP